MPEDPAAPKPPTPSRDKETIAQSVYPSLGQVKQASAVAAAAAVAREETYERASSAFDEALTIGLGLASSLTPLLLTYFLKNRWAVIIVGAVLAAAAIFFALRNYHNSGKVSPLTVIGLAGATIALVQTGNLLLTEAILRSRYPSSF